MRSPPTSGSSFPIKKTAGFHLRVEPMQEDLVADVQPVILTLMGAVVLRDAHRVRERRESAARARGGART